MSLSALAHAGVIYLVHRHIPDEPIQVVTLDEYVRRTDAHQFYTRLDWQNARAKQALVAATVRGRC